MENETKKAIWQKPEIIDLDIEETSKSFDPSFEAVFSGPSGS